MSFFSEFKSFAMKGNVVDLAVGVIIGGAFGKIIDSLVNDIIMPLIGRLLGGGVDFSQLFIVLGDVPPGVPIQLAELKKANIPVFAYGNFITIVINFILLALVIFVMIKQMNKLRDTPPPAPKEPPEEVKLLREIRDSLKR